MKKLDLRYRDYVSLVTILLLGFYCFTLSVKLRVLTVGRVSSRVQLEEGNNVNDFITLYFSDDTAVYLSGEKRNIKDLTPFIDTFKDIEVCFQNKLDLTVEEKIDL